MAISGNNPYEIYNKKYKLKGHLNLCLCVFFEMLNYVNIPRYFAGFASS